MSMWQGVVDWLEHERGSQTHADGWLGWDAWVEAQNDGQPGYASVQAQPVHGVTRATRHGIAVDR